MLLQAAAATGPCSKQQVQLYSLLRSMLKWAAMLDNTLEHQQQQQQQQLLLQRQ